MSERTRTRSIQRPGFSRLRTIGRRSDVFGDFYHFVLSLRWWQFLSLASTVFIAVNALFAGLYLVEPGSITAPADDDFASSFFFSVQTMATIGYGGMAPATRFADVLVTIEAALGMMFTALITGLTFARFARPTARVLFS
ncbi:MAG: hypothetical protein KC636_25595, partial [Myxococcales bacterium]|nr:hypothetical protein [Myxococcales bacterium]